MNDILEKYPFRSVFTLKPLIDFWKQTLVSSHPDKVCLMRDLQERLDEAPELQKPIEDFSILDEYHDLLKCLMSAVFPPAFWETNMVGALAPFYLQPVFVSPSFRRLFLNHDGSMRGRPHLEGETYAKVRLMRTYFFILEKLYGIRQDVSYPMNWIVPDSETGLDRYYRITPDLRFVEVHVAGEHKELSEEERKMVLDHLTEPEVLRRILPPENFEFHGFSVVQAVDVTEPEVLSDLERDLIGRESITSKEGFLRLQQRLRILFGRPELMAGLAAIQEDKVLLLNNGCEMSRNCIFADSRHIPITDFEGSVFHGIIEGKGIITIQDLRERPTRSRVDEELIQAGIRSFLIAPLYYQGELIGTLDLGSLNPDEWRPKDDLLINQILPLFSVALKRALDEFNNQIQRVIKEKCTAVHPSVEWRFRKAAFHHMDRLRTGQVSELEPIIFKDVYPLYSSSDIRGSSDERNRAIQTDLVEHLNLTLEVIRLSGEARPLPLLNVFAHRIQRHLERIQKGMGSGDETSVVNFLRQEVEPVFSHLRGLGPKVTRAVEAYESAMDPHVGTVFRRRKDFEESVSLLNERISTYLDQEEADAQTFFPHYFEKHKTDGVDYLIYIGASMAENGGFSEFYVQNLRLWQMMAACGIAWHTEQLKASLKLPLDTAHLILVQNSPMSIRFRFDEKRFDVDGAYDIRHEIIKSRIDKAVIKGRNERLTQPGRIAIVYSQPQEAREIRRYIDYLQHQDYLTGDLESLDVEELPGVKGLKALRIGINLNSSILSERVERMAG
jgi:hypothetical protein